VFRCAVSVTLDCAFLYIRLLGFSGSLWNVLMPEEYSVFLKMCYVGNSPMKMAPLTCVISV